MFSELIITAHNYSQHKSQNSADLSVCVRCERKAKSPTHPRTFVSNVVLNIVYCCRLKGLIKINIHSFHGHIYLVCTKWDHTGLGGDRHPVIGPCHLHLPRQAPLRGVGVQLIDRGQVADHRVRVDITACEKTILSLS